MKSADQNAELVWQHILAEVRAEKRHRRGRRVMAAAASVIAIVTLLLRFPAAALPGEALPPSRAATIPMVTAETVVVMKVSENGSVRLEEMPFDELGSVELNFGLTPLLADSTE